MNTKTYHQGFCGCCGAAMQLSMDDEGQWGQEAGCPNHGMLPTIDAETYQKLKSLHRLASLEAVDIPSIC